MKDPKQGKDNHSGVNSLAEGSETPQFEAKSVKPELDLILRKKKEL